MKSEHTSRPHLTSCRFPVDSLVEVMARLRREDGCPWDLEQDHRSLKPYVIEEAYELLDAIDEATSTGDDRGLLEELGDLLLQVVFHAQIASESDRFTMNDVITGIRNKLIRRHPHIFADADAPDKASVERRWEEIKKEEKSEAQNAPASRLDGIPKALPALALAAEMQKRAAKVGFEWEHVDGALAKVAEEVREIEAEQQAPSPRVERLEHEWGDLLFSLVNVARYSGIDPESALVGAAGRFQKRFQHIETKAAEAGRDLEAMSLSEMDALWEEAKKKEG